MRDTETWGTALQTKQHREQEEALQTTQRHNGFLRESFFFRKRVLKHSCRPDLAGLFSQKSNYSLGSFTEDDLQNEGDHPGTPYQTCVRGGERVSSHVIYE